MRSLYDQVRLIVMFDLPMDTKECQKAYNKFRKFLLDDGFLMLQYSVYVRYCHNNSDSDKHFHRIQCNNPKYGNVRILKITEKQYVNMKILYGEATEQENIITSKELTVIE